MIRRNFLKSSLLSVPFLNFLNSLKENESNLKKNNKSCVLIWLGGGPSTIDMFDLKPHSKNAGEFKPIQTNVNGIEICEHLPKLATTFNDLSIIRSMSTREADHMRGSYYLHTGFIPTPSVVHPTAGSVFSFESKTELDIPSFISINPTSFKSGYLGVKYDPFVVLEDGSIPNLNKNSNLNKKLSFLNEIENNFINSNRGDMPNSHKEIYSNTINLINSNQSKVFNTFEENEDTKIKYGNSSIGKSLLLTRRLIMAGVPFVEVNYNGWDMHSDIFNSLKFKLSEFDQSLHTFIQDLKSLNMYKNTTIVCMGEFGRTPKINQDSGRDHWANAWSILLGGGSLKNGQVLGKTSKDGTLVEESPYNAGNVWSTVSKSMGIEINTHTSKNGRPMKMFNGDNFIESLF
jgi:hypothetical protein